MYVNVCMWCVMTAATDRMMAELLLAIDGKNGEINALNVKLK